MKRTAMEKLQGVYCREHPTRKHNGKSDRCYDIAYRTAGGRQGKLIWEKVGWASEGYTAQMASQVRAERIRAVRHGEELPQERRKKEAVTFGILWGKYADWAKVNTKAFGREENRYKKHLEQSLKNLPLDEITPFIVEKIKDDMLADGKAPATAKHALTLIRQIINKGIAWDLWRGENPVSKIRLPKLNNERKRFLTKGEAEQLLNELAITSPQWRDIALLSLHTGMRAGEIFALKWEHLDIDNGVIQITDPKGGPAQTAFMTATVKEIFRTRLEECCVGNWVFKSRDGGQVKEVSDTFERTVKRLGFNEGITDDRQKVVFHTCRHTFASWLALAGTPILTIKELMRYASLAMTERYAHLIPDHKRQAIDVIEQKMNS